MEPGLMEPGWLTLQDSEKYLLALVCGKGQALSIVKSRPPQAPPRFASG